jgi:hypothetical protein
MAGRITPEWPPDNNPFDPANRLMWEEYVQDYGPRQDTVTHGECLSTLRGYVLSHDWLLPAIGYWLGYAWVDYSVTPPIMRRKLPAAHPELDQTFARRVAISGFSYDKRIEPLPPNGDNPYPPKVPWARYKKYLLEIDFQMVDYKVLPDGYIITDPIVGDRVITDWDRFVSIETEDDTEMVAVEGGTYVYRGGAAASQPIIVPGAQLKKYVERSILTLTAHQLPYDLVYNPFDIPIKLMQARGKVNSTLFRGCNSQTMVLLGSKQKKYPQPVATATWTVLQFGVDIEFKFGFQDPTKAVATETQAGWNLWPLVGQAWSDGWYGAQSNDAAALPLYPSKDMNKLLTHWSDTNLF